MAAIVPAMRVMRCRVIIDRNPIAEKFDADEAGQDDRARLRAATLRLGPRLRGREQYRYGGVAPDTFSAARPRVHRLSHPGRVLPGYRR
jgi:hypothetical protein